MTDKVKCYECDTARNKKDMFEVETYDTPWDDEPTIHYYCKAKPEFHKYVEDCLELAGDTSWADFRYFTCNRCYRFICEQNPRNGWMVQYRIINECEQLCLRCYQEHILENGIEREAFETGKLPGMFFSNDNHEPLDAGYHIEMYNVRVGNPQPVIDKALELIDTGHKVVIGYESMAIGGLEGYVTLFAK